MPTSSTLSVLIASVPVAFLRAGCARAGVSIAANACALMAAGDTAVALPTTKPLAPVRCQQGR